MCIVPTKKDVKNLQDVKFLVGSVINRQNKSFSANDIYDTVRINLQGSPTSLSNDELSKIVQNQIDLLYRNCYLRFSEKKYTFNDSLATD